MQVIEAVVGDDIDFEFTVYGPDAVANLTGATFEVVGRRRHGGSTVVTGSATAPSPLTGVVLVTIPALQTATGFTRAESLWLEVQMTQAERTRTVLRRRLRLLPQTAEG